MSRILSSAALAATLFAVTGLAGLGAITGACSSSSPGGGGGGGGDSGGGGGGDSGGGGAPLCAPPTGCPPVEAGTTELTTPSVSFNTQVVPIFQMSCSLSSSCHSMAAGGPSLLYLGGPASAPADPTGILKAILNVKSLELTSMNYVTPGDPGNSFLMHKMDGDQCQYSPSPTDSMCSMNPVPSCGVVMPQAGCALDVGTRDTVRRWIAQGAMNN